MSTLLMFRDDAYLTTCDATVEAIDDGGGVILDRTVFYATGGGQPGDRGVITGADGSPVPITSAVWSPDKSRILHLPAPEAPTLRPGDRVSAAIDWPTRLKRMRIHTALHLLTTVLPYPVTGGAIGDGEGRLDFDIPDAVDREAVAEELARRIGRNADVTERWITDDELLANPTLVKTMSVKPPMGSGRVRLVEIAGLDLQPCGGTHVRNTSEIGEVAVTAIEKKGKINRRVRIALV